MSDMERKLGEQVREAFLKEDKGICERNQRGMRSRTKHGGQLVELERVVVDFQQYLGQKLYGHRPDAHFVDEGSKRFA